LLNPANSSRKEAREIHKEERAHHRTREKITKNPLNKTIICLSKPSRNRIHPKYTIKQNPEVSNNKNSKA
jgi:hypothetical protein